MRWFLSLPVLTLLALPVSACAQSQPAPQPPTAGADAGQYQPGTLPPEPPVIEPPLPGQADNMQPPPGPDDGQPPLPGQDQPGAQPGYADNMAPPPGGADGQPPPPPPGAFGAPGAAHEHNAEMMRKLQARFDTANTTHDGRLTLQQAEEAGMRSIAKHFSQIDRQHLGYVTFNQVMAWRMDQMAQQMARRAAALRAQQDQ